MNGKFVYSKESCSINLFGREFWQHYIDKRLKFTFKGEVKVLNAYFVSTIGINFLSLNMFPYRIFFSYYPFQFNSING